MILLGLCGIIIMFCRIVTLENEPSFIETLGLFAVSVGFMWILTFGLKRIYFRKKKSLFPFILILVMLITSCSPNLCPAYTKHGKIHTKSLMK